MDNQEEMEEFLEKYNLLRLNEEEIQNVNIPQLLLIKSVIKKKKKLLATNQSVRPDCFTDELHTLNI